MAWATLFVSDITIAEKIFRAVIIYGFLLVAFRLTGKRLAHLSRVVSSGTAPGKRGRTGAASG